MAVLYWIRAVGNQVGMVVSHWLWCALSDQPVGPLVSEHGNLAIEQGAVNMLTFAGALPTRDSRQDRGSGIHAGEFVGNGDPCLQGFSSLVYGLRLAGNAHQPSHSLNKEVISGAAGIGTGLT